MSNGENYKAVCVFCDEKLKKDFKELGRHNFYDKYKRYRDRRRGGRGRGRGRGRRGRR